VKLVSKFIASSQYGVFAEKGVDNYDHDATHAVSVMETKS
jgi:hypothetical protein